MKTLGLVVSSMTLFAATAFASGIDLSVVACPGNPGASSDAGALDCAGGQVLSVIVSFVPPADVTANTMDYLLDAFVSGGDLSSSADFWNFDDGENLLTFEGSERPPSSGCSGYVAPWSVPAGYVSMLAYTTGTSTFHIHDFTSRPSAITFSANVKYFGVQLTFDTSPSVEFGGRFHGCALPVCMVLQQITPSTDPNFPPTGTPMTSPGAFGNMLTINGSSVQACFTVPVKRYTWGRLKSLYR